MSAQSMDSSEKGGSKKYCPELLIHVFILISVESESISVVCMERGKPDLAQSNLADKDIATVQEIAGNMRVTDVLVSILPRLVLCCTSKCILHVFILSLPTCEIFYRRFSRQTEGRCHPGLQFEAHQTPRSYVRMERSSTSATDDPCARQLEGTRPRSSRVGSHRIISQPPRS
jgi:hypothetical protein